MFVHTKTKWLWFLVLIVLVVLTLFLWRGSGGPGQVSTRFVGRTMDSTGQVHIIYEISNETRSAIGVRVSTLQAHHERTGWWDVRGNWRTAWGIEKTAGIAHNPDQPALRARSAARLEIVQPRFWREGSAVRGKIWHIKIESGVVAQLRSFASRLGLPAQRLMSPKPGFLDLPEAGLTADAQATAPPPAIATVAQQTTSAPIDSRPSEQVLPAGSINLQSASLRSVLDIYAELADAHLEIDPRVRILNAEITLQPTQSLTRSDVVRLLERTLQQQADLTIRHSPSNRIEVTLGQRPKTNPPR